MRNDTLVVEEFNPVFDLASGVFGRVSVVFVAGRGGGELLCSPLAAVLMLWIPDKVVWSR